MTADSAQNAPAALVVGAAGGLGAAVVGALVTSGAYRVLTVSRAGTPPHLGVARHWCSDYSDEAIHAVAEDPVWDSLDLQRIVIANGVLHGEGFQPERALRRLDRAAALHVLEVNTLLPLLWLAALEKRLKRASSAKVAVLSARVGSIGDNRLGGWYSYRASKSALNMMLKSAAIEFRRLNPRIRLLAFHPGTVDTALSEPFQKGLPPGQLFEADTVAERLLGILDNLAEEGELAYLDWAGEPIPW